MPLAFVPAVAASASSTVMPATKRPERRRPIALFSANERSGRFPEREMKIARNMLTLFSSHCLRHGAHAPRSFAEERFRARPLRLAGSADVVDDENRLPLCARACLKRAAHISRARVFRQERLGRLLAAAREEHVARDAD